ncbi:hypothetical protein BY458DRAFT_441058 [Sporodiniella umbellata]|nr:hypothetical protein BY458DRAFT_441058 [Sporodiniella umbellata]
MEGNGYMSNNFDSGSSEGGFARKPMPEQTLRPVTIKQIKTADTQTGEGSCKVDGADCTQITFIGIIRNIHTLQMNTVYTIEDGTGSVDVRRWIEQNETEEESEDRHSLVADAYVRVYGRLGQFNGRTNVVAFTIRPIVDHNEITYHLLEAIHSHISYTKPSKKNSLYVEASSNSVSDRIMDILKDQHHLEDGVHIDYILEKLKNVHSEKEVREGLSYILNEGQCYTTLDDNHFKSCMD